MSQGVLYRHEYTHPHTAAAILEIISWLRCQIFQLSPYCIDHAPSDYQVAGLLKNALKELRFHTEIDEAMNFLLKEQHKKHLSLIFGKIKKFVKRHGNCIEKEGEDAENIIFVSLIEYRSITYVICWQFVKHLRIFRVSTRSISYWKFVYLHLSCFNFQVEILILGLKVALGAKPGTSQLRVKIITKIGIESVCFCPVKLLSALSFKHHSHVVNYCED